MHGLDVHLCSKKKMPIINYFPSGMHIEVHPAEKGTKNHQRFQLEIVMPPCESTCTHQILRSVCFSKKPTSNRCLKRPSRPRNEVGMAGDSTWGWTLAFGPWGLGGLIFKNSLHIDIACYLSYLSWFIKDVYQNLSNDKPTGSKLFFINQWLVYEITII